MTSDRSRYVAGIVAGVATNLLWALAIVAPVLLPEQSALALTLGRYTAYGVVSVAAIALMRGSGVRHLGRREWLTALVFAAAGNAVYYFLFVMAVANAGAAIAAAIIGSLPITVALYGNWRRREFPFARLLWPILLILAGLVVINIAEWDVGATAIGAQRRGLGIACALVALALWTWYAIANADFLKQRPRLRAGAWSTAIGAATLLLVIVALPIALATQAGGDAVATLRDGDARAWWRFVAGSVVLGVAVSWGGTLLWNRASERLPVALAGQLIVLETVAGMTYVFAAQGRAPSLMTVVGIGLLIVGVILGIRRTKPETIEARVTSARGCDHSREAA